MAVYRIAFLEDFDVLKSLDRHLPADDIIQKIRREEYVVLVVADKIIGFIRYGFFWDEYPFMNLLWVMQSDRGKGYGRELVLKWEESMAARGYKTVMTSTQVDEFAQHFYRKLGYKDIGGFTLTGEVLELVMVKETKV